MKGKPSAANFKHEPLPDSTAYIRLLKIKTAKYNGPVVCLLTAWPVAEAPYYYALSYTWGSPTPSRQILINGSVFAVGQNCVDALEQAHASKASRYFWMDALCIDQSNTQEKGHQVGMMGQIYEKSKHVLACVGPHSNSSIFFYRAIDKNRHLLASIHRLTLRPTFANSRDWIMPNPIPKSFRVAVQSILTVSDRDELATGFIEFMERPYFSRVWILQELHLAPKISLCCGSDRRPFDHLLAVSILVEFWVDLPIYRDSLSSGVLSLVHARLGSRQDWCLKTQRRARLPSRHGFDRIYSQRGCLTLASEVRKRRRLAEVLESMQSFQCSDIRDRLFGVQALVDWGRNEAPVPNYDKDNYRLAIEVLRLYLQNPETEPVSGSVIEWPRSLWETFQVDVEGPAIQDAITERFGSHRLDPPSCSPLDIYGYVVDDTSCIKKPKWSLEDRSNYLHNPTPYHWGTTWYRDYVGHPRDTWYGIQLRDIKDITKESPIPGDLPSHYLYCSFYGSKFRSPVRILDHTHCLFGHAPPYTRPSDWLVFSEETSLFDGTPVMVALRSVNDDHSEYKIIGPAAKHCGYEGTVLPRHRPVSFGVKWDPEDLFLFSCVYDNYMKYSEPTKKAPDWELAPARPSAMFPATEIRNGWYCI